MSLRYSLIVPYFRTPEITRFCLHSIFRFAKGEPDVVVINNDPSDSGSAMLDEFPRIRRFDNPTAARGSTANFEALRLGVQHAQHELLGFLHSDTVFLQDGWDTRWFGELQRGDFSAVGTLEREANPFLPLRKRLRTAWHALRHDSRPKRGKLMLHWLLTRKSVLNDPTARFLGVSDPTCEYFSARLNGVQALSSLEVGRVLWHVSDVTSVVTGQMRDADAVKDFSEKRRRFLDHPTIRRHFADVLDRTSAVA